MIVYLLLLTLDRWQTNTTIWTNVLFFPYITIHTMNYYIMYPCYFKLLKVYWIKELCFRAKYPCSHIFSYLWKLVGLPVVSKFAHACTLCMTRSKVTTKDYFVTKFIIYLFTITSIVGLCGNFQWICLCVLLLQKGCT